MIAALLGIVILLFVLVLFVTFIIPVFIVILFIMGGILVLMMGMHVVLRVLGRKGLVEKTGDGGVTIQITEESFQRREE